MDYIIITIKSGCTTWRNRLLLPLAVLIRLAYVLVSIYIYSYVASCMQYVPIARPSHKQRGRSGAGGVRCT